MSRGVHVLYVARKEARGHTYRLACRKQNLSLRVRGGVHDLSSVACARGPQLFVDRLRNFSEISRRPRDLGFVLVVFIKPMVMKVFLLATALLATVQGSFLGGAWAPRASSRVACVTMLADDQASSSASDEGKNTLRKQEIDVDSAAADAKSFLDEPPEASAPGAQKKLVDVAALEEPNDSLKAASSGDKDEAEDDDAAAAAELASELEKRAELRVAARAAQRAASPLEDQATEELLEEEEAPTTSADKTTLAKPDAAAPPVLHSLGQTAIKGLRDAAQFDDLEPIGG